MWAPDSQSIVIRKRSLLPTGASHYEMFHVPVDGTPPRRIDANINLGINPHDFRVHPDGRRVAFHVGVEAAAPTSREVWLVENLLTRSPSGR
jgi:hypothetical protein